MTTQTITGPAVTLNVDALRAWLGSRSQMPVGDDTFTVADGMGDEATSRDDGNDLLSALDSVLTAFADGDIETPPAGVWVYGPGVRSVQFFRTYDGDGCDGALIHVDFDNGLRVSSLHQDFRDFASADVAGVDAAVSAVVALAEEANRLVARYHAAVLPLPVDWDRKQASAFVAGLDDVVREMLTDILRERADGESLTRACDAIMAGLGSDEVRQELALPVLDPLAMVKGVVFTPEWHDNGYFLTCHGKVITLDGERYYIDFPVELQEAFTELYGGVGNRSGFAFCPATGESEFSDSAAEWELEPWLDQQMAGFPERYAPVRVTKRGAVHAGELARREPLAYNPVCSQAGGLNAGSPTAAPVYEPVTCSHCRSGYPTATEAADHAAAAVRP